MGMTERSKSLAKKMGLGSRKQKSSMPIVPPCTLNNDFESRLERFRERKIINERGITKSKLEHTNIPQMIDRMGWATYAGSPPAYCSCMVEELYDATVPENSWEMHW
ncbi:hypothetical protein Ddye_023420 [Dipteronia dyeriana]|uniref:Uncharacterized protein n=1 Tax=Dipteronia dyeriana TaxID=168575 RepID=A0AAD9WTB5_9ROSI|nr:hypothetical protein Ddye_023420 [Dipteronia dyeriana]